MCSAERHRRRRDSLPIPGGDRDVEALFEQHGGDRESDSRRAAGNERGPRRSDWVHRRSSSRRLNGVPASQRLSSELRMGELVSGQRIIEKAW
jgi:hypothetical protein